MGQRQILRGRCEQRSGAARKIKAGDDQACARRAFSSAAPISAASSASLSADTTPNVSTCAIWRKRSERAARLAVARIETGGVDDDERFLRDAIDDEFLQVRRGLGDGHAGIQMLGEGFQPRDGAGACRVGCDQRDAAIVKPRMRGKLGGDSRLSCTIWSDKQQRGGGRQVDRAGRHALVDARRPEPASCR